MDGLEYPPHHHSPVQQGGGAKTESAVGGGDEVDHSEGLPGLRQAARSGNVHQILWEDHDGFG